MNDSSQMAYDDNPVPMSLYAKLVFDKVRRFWALLVFITLLAIIFAFLMLVNSKPKYVATAEVGPAKYTLDSGSMGLGGGAAGLLGAAGKMGIGGGASALLGSKSTFDQYTELLTSNRLAAKLAADPNVLRSVFFRKYDWDENHWRRPGAVSTFIKELIHYPVKQKPDVDDMAKFLSEKVTVDAPLTSTFVTVTLEAKDPKEAEWLLSTMLLGADTIIREDRRRDVAARIAYLDSVLPTVTQSEQKDALISILSDQQQSMMTIEADKRYASALVDPPHADLKPSKPKPVMFLALGIFLALASWGLLIFVLGEEHRLVQRLDRISRFGRRRSGQQLEYPLGDETRL